MVSDSPQRHYAERQRGRGLIQIVFVCSLVFKCLECISQINSITFIIQQLLLQLCNPQ
uniref:Uncharacterized protein n=1 Tax=Anguilla anguilla TaxID=7936 RepID=A0A0E9QQX8_ANGAN